MPYRNLSTNYITEVSEHTINNNMNRNLTYVKVIKVHSALSITRPQNMSINHFQRLFSTRTKKDSPNTEFI